MSASAIAAQRKSEATKKALLIASQPSATFGQPSETKTGPLTQKIKSG
jgi:hypothetical protein